MEQNSSHYSKSEDLKNVYALFFNIVHLDVSKFKRNLRGQITQLILRVTIITLVYPKQDHSDLKSTLVKSLGHVL